MRSDPGRHLVLDFYMATRLMRPLPLGNPSPAVHQRGTWSFALRPAGEGACRLLVRGRGVSDPAWRWLPLSTFWLAHVVMQRKQLLGIPRDPTDAEMRDASIFRDRR